MQTVYNFNLLIEGLSPNCLMVIRLSDTAKRQIRTVTSESPDKHKDRQTDRQTD